MPARAHKATGARHLRPLNAPRPVEVTADADGQPLTIRRPDWSRPRAVQRVQDRWRIDDEWWRAHPVSRLYFAVLLADGTLMMVYRDLLSEQWFAQREA